jgi:membrane protease YdiL (CAAX protease family)
MNSLLDLPAIAKIGLFLLIWFLAWLPLAIPLAYRLQWHPLQETTPQQKLPLVASLYLIFPPLLWLLLHSQNIALADYGILWNRELAISLLLGLGLGVGGLALTFGLETWGGWIEWKTHHWSKALKLSPPLLLLGLWIGWTEELIFRGIFQTELQKDYGVGLAAAIASLIFALLHLSWERKNTFPQLPGLWLMGMILVEARILNSGSLGLAWGLHAAWIWGLASLDAADLLHYPDSSPDWMVGIGKYPLAGLAGIACLLVTGWLLWQGKQWFYL